MGHVIEEVALMPSDLLFDEQSLGARYHSKVDSSFCLVHHVMCTCWLYLIRTTKCM